MISFIIGTTIGLIGVFGIGHIKLGYKQRGYMFLKMSGVLYALGLIAALFSEGLWGYLPAVWGIMWLAQSYDIYKLDKNKAREA
jgi:hypothetical protein